MKPTQQNPPEWPDRFLEWYCAEYYLEEVQGDLHEWFELENQRVGYRKASLRYWIMVFRYFSLFRLKPFQKLIQHPNYLSMKAIAKLTFRNLRRDKLSGLIRIGNFTLGITIFLLSLVYARYELSYDQFHEKADRIFRVGSSAEGNKWAATPMGMGPFVQDNGGEVLHMTRMAPIRNTTIKFEDKLFYEKNGFYADSSFFQMFSFELVRGDKQSVLTDPRSIVITERMAQKYFGDQDPMGKQLELSSDSDREGNIEPRIVSGVMRDLPEQSHLQFDYLCSIYSFNERFSRQWRNFWVYTYVELAPGATTENTKSIIKQELASIRDIPEDELSLYHILMVPIKQIHLYTNHEKEYADNGNVYYVYILFSIGLFVLIISCINFINLTVIKGLDRSKEVGLRKVVGANRSQLVVQFLGENSILLSISGIICLSALALLAPVFQEFSGLKLPLNVFTSPTILIALIGILITLQVISGLYPALVLSRFMPAETLKSGSQSRSMKKVGLTRQVLMIAQFCISVILVISSMVVYDQLAYIQSRDLGFEKDQVLLIRLERSITGQFNQFENELLQVAGIKSVSTSSSVPGYRIMLEGMSELGSSEEYSSRLLYADETFLETYDIKLLEGRHFDPTIELGNDEYMFNQTAAKRFFGDRNPINQEITISGDTGIVVGVIEDFNFQTLHAEVEPLTISNLPPAIFGYASIKYEAQATDKVLAAIERASLQVYPNLPPLEVEFLDQRFEQLYLAESKLMTIVWVFCIITILLTISGVFGVASYNAHQRAKEIAIRKVLGGSLLELLKQLSKGFAWLLLFALLIGLPGAYYLSNWWLEDFAYRITLSPGIFLLAGLSMLIIIALSSGMITLRTAHSDPAKVLKSE
ncbi:MAG: ABC transporter permease [Cytophagales bacterium]|nr:ABC transporter permease [Cytophagales bacterium]